MGQIIKFPIIVLEDTANEERFGITPQLRSTIRQLASASTSEVGSEQAIREAIDNLTFEVSGSNLGNGLSGFVDVSGNNNIYFNTISGLGVLEVTSDTNHIYIDTTQAGIPNDITSAVIINKRTINGGIEQEASKINYANFDSSSGVNTSGQPIFYNVEYGDSIGKILIKCTEGFDDTTTEFSIGTYDNPSGYIRPFSAPTSATTDKLVNFTYGTFMNEKIEYIERNKVNVMYLYSDDSNNYSSKYMNPSYWYNETSGIVSLKTFNLYNNTLTGNILNGVDYLIVGDGSDSEFKSGTIATPEMAVISEAWNAGMNISFHADNGVSGTLANTITNMTSYPWDITYDNSAVSPTNPTSNLPFLKYYNWMGQTTTQFCEASPGTISTHGGDGEVIWQDGDGNDIVGFEPSDYKHGFMYVGNTNQGINISNLILEIFNKKTTRSSTFYDSLSGSNEIRAFMYNGGSNTQGELDCVIFYDRNRSGVLFTGGNDGSTTNTINFLQYSNETASFINGTLLYNKDNHSLLYNHEYIWNCGGGATSSVRYSDCEKIQKSNFTNNSLYRFSLLTTKTRMGESRTKIYGYLFGGTGLGGSGYTDTDIIERFTFSTDTSSIDTGANLQRTKNGMAVVENSNFAWIAGGTDGNASSFYNEIDKYDFQSDSSNTTDRLDLLSNNFFLKGASSYNYGYFFGGASDASTTLNTIQRLEYASDTGTCGDRADLIASLHRVSTSIDNSTYVYIAGGTSFNSGEGLVDFIQKYDVTVDTINPLYRTNLPTAKAGMSNGGEI